MAAFPTQALAMPYTKNCDLKMPGEKVGGIRLPLGLPTTHCAVPLTSTSNVAASYEVLSPGQDNRDECHLYPH